LQKGDFLFFERISEENVEKAIIDTKRAIQPLKSFFIPPQRKVSEYFSFSSGQEQEERIILGVKSCDLRALRVSDSVYSGEEFGKEYKDPFYIQAREKTTLISCDCLSPDDHCFCTLVGVNPFPEEGFDLNLSSIEDGFVVQVGSEKGEKLVKKNDNLFSSADEKKEKRFERRLSDG